MITNILLISLGFVAGILFTWFMLPFIVRLVMGLALRP
jgi:hypothetical protein